MPGIPYGSGKYGAGIYGFGGGTNPPNPVTNFTVSNVYGSNGTQLYLTWTNPTSADFQGVRIIRRTDTFATAYTDVGTGTYFDLDDPISNYTDSGLTNFTIYYYTIFTHDEVPNYSTIAVVYTIQTIYSPEVSKFLDDKITNAQAIVDLERVVLYWDNLSRTLNFKALVVDSSSVGLTTSIASVDSSNPQTIFYADSSGLSVITDKYKNERLVFLDSFNRISEPKAISAYVGASNKFTIEEIEYPLSTNETFGLSYIKNVVDDESLYLGGNLIYDTSVHQISGFNTSTKTFTVDTSNPYTLQAGNAFSVPMAHYPKLYISKDRGATFDDGTDLVYVVASDATANFLGEGYFYNSIICNNTSLLNVTDANFYIGAYITFLTGRNKGYSKKIKSFNRSTREFKTDYFAYPILQDEIFAINTYSVPLVRGISDYLFKIVLWNNNNGLPLYGHDVLISPALSFNRYLTALNNGYWDVNLNTDLYKLLQGIIKEAHSKAEIEADLQRKDFGITEVRDNKLFTNFGQYFDYEKPNSLQSIRYRRSLQDLIAAFRNTSTFEGLYNAVRAFYRITPVVTYLSETGWRCGRERLGYEREIINTTVTVADTSSPSIIIDSSSASLNTSLGYYSGDYLAVTDVPAASTFNQALIGQIIPIVDSSATGNVVRFTIDPISVPVPAGSTVKVFDVNYNVNYNTIPYSELANLFGVSIQIYGPFMSASIKTLLETLAAKALPLHVRKSFHYNTNFVGETSFGTFGGDLTGLEVAYETNTIVPDKDTFDELSETTESITSTVATVAENYSKFTIANGTYKHNYYKNKKILFTTGNNAGIVKRVIEYIGGSNQIVTEPFPYVIQIGDVVELESVKYLTKYTTQTFDLTPAELSVDLVTDSYFTTWFTRKTNMDLKEYVFIEFSDGVSSGFTPKRRITQGELLNPVINCVVDTSSATTTTFTATGTDAELFNIDSYYVNAYIEFTSGQNIGEYREVTAYTGQTKSFITDAFPYAPAIDDTFKIIISDMRRYAKITIYHNDLSSDSDFEIESLTINIL